jgi:hypothetical protein
MSLVHFEGILATQIGAYVTQSWMSCFYLLSRGLTVPPIKLFDFTGMAARDTEEPENIDPYILGRGQVFWGPN